MQPPIMEHSPRILSSNPKLKGVVLKPDLTPTRLSNYSLGRDSSNNSRTDTGSKLVKHQFKLRDLPIYSKTLRFNNKKDGKKMDAFVKTVLGGKYLRNMSKEENMEDESERKPKEEDDTISQSSARKQNIEWTSTPVYKQFVLKLTEMESLEDNFIGVRRARQYRLDLADPEIKKKLL
jgi:E3 ubiquitin-protein ligase DOA10